MKTTKRVTSVICFSFLSVLAFAFPKTAEAACPAGSEQMVRKGTVRSATLCIGSDLLGRAVRQGAIRVVEDGRLFAQGSYLDGRRHGIWTEYNGRGEAIAQWSYRHGRLLSGEGPRPLSNKALLEFSRRTRTQPTGATAAAPPISGAKRTTASPKPTSALQSSGPSQSTPSATPAPASANPPHSNSQNSWQSVEDEARRKEFVGWRMQSNFTYARLQGASAYGLDLLSELRLGSVFLESDLGLGFVSAGPATLTAFRNPSLFATLRQDVGAVNLRYGIGLSVPVLSVGESGGGIESIAVAAAVGVASGYVNMWHFLPNAVGVVIPFDAEGQIGRFTLRGEADALLPIPTQAGSTDLLIQLAVDGSYQPIDILRVGHKTHLVWLGVTNGVQGALSFEPYAALSYDRYEARAGVQLTPLLPSGGVGGESFVWSTHFSVAATLL